MTDWVSLVDAFDRCVLEAEEKEKDAEEGEEDGDEMDQELRQREKGEAGILIMTPVGARQP